MRVSGTAATRVAALIVVLYILAQGFQEVAYRVLGEPTDPAAALLLGGHALNIARAALLLVSFFGMAFVLLVICAELWARRPLAAAGALLAFLTFLWLEIGLRSVELFWVFLRLPGEYARAPQATLDSAATFAAVQSALYFPLLAGHLIGSLVIALGVPRHPKRNYLLVGAFGLNALRLAGRIASLHLHVGVLDVLSGDLYLPLVVLVYAPIAVWLYPRYPAARAAASASSST